MSITFTKLFSSITESTVWGEPDQVRIVWITMLAMCDFRGRVWASVPGLAHRARVSVDDVKIALATFLSPDPYSRTTDNEGRRIEVIDGGWRLLNYDKYREIQGDKSAINPTTKETVGKVYFIQCGTSVKIGFSVNPWARLASLKTGMPEEPKLLGYIHGTPSDEKKLHERFNKDKLNREWFTLSRDISTFIETECATGSDLVVNGSELPQLQQEAEAEAEAEAELKKKVHISTSKRSKPKTSLPEGFTISDAVKAWAEKHKHYYLDLRLDHFTDTALAKGYQYVDWDAAFRKAIREDWAKMGTDPPPSADPYANHPMGMYADWPSPPAEDFCIHGWGLTPELRVKHGDRADHECGQCHADARKAAETEVTV